MSALSHPWARTIPHPLTERYVELAEKWERRITAETAPCLAIEYRIQAAKARQRADDLRN